MGRKSRTRSQLGLPRVPSPFRSGDPTSVVTSSPAKSVTQEEERKFKRPGSLEIQGRNTGRDIQRVGQTATEDSAHFPSLPWGSRRCLSGGAVPSTILPLVPRSRRLAGYTQVGRTSSGGTLTRTIPKRTTSSVTTVPEPGTATNKAEQNRKPGEVNDNKQTSSGAASGGEASQVSDPKESHNDDRKFSCAIGLTLTDFVKGDVGGVNRDNQGDVFRDRRTPLVLAGRGPSWAS